MTKTPTNDAIVQETMGSLDNVGCILVLVGPSSVGKSLMVEGMQKLDNEKPEENKRNWEIDGVDAASQRMFGKLNNEYKNAIGEDPVFYHYDPNSLRVPRVIYFILCMKVASMKRDFRARLRSFLISDFGIFLALF